MRFYHNLSPKSKIALKVFLFITIPIWLLPMAPIVMLIGGCVSVYESIGDMLEGDNDGWD